MIVKRTLQSICVLTVNPNTTTSIIVQVRIFTIDCEHEHLNHACIAKYLSYSNGPQLSTNFLACYLFLNFLYPLIIFLMNS